MAYITPNKKPYGILRETRKLKATPIRAIIILMLLSFEIMPAVKIKASCKINKIKYLRFNVYSPFLS